MDLDYIKSLIVRLRRGKSDRERFVESHLAKGIAHQIRTLRETLGMSQTELAEKVGMNQNAISRLESAEYGKPTITTLKRLAAAFDVALVVRFVPFSEMVNWISGTAHVSKGLSTETIIVPTFSKEEEGSVLDSLIPNGLALESLLSIADEVQDNPVDSYREGKSMSKKFRPAVDTATHADIRFTRTVPRWSTERDIFRTRRTETGQDKITLASNVQSVPVS